MSVLEMQKLERAVYPEEAGVDTYVLQDFFNELKSTGYRFKNIMVVRHGKVVAECTKYPFVQQMPHTMFSFSKAVTAVAIGFAISEGLLRLDTTLAELFSDTYDEKALKKIEGITVRHLLTMTAGKSVSFFANKEKSDWLDSFIKARKYAPPGEKFKYISENTYVLGRMLAKVSGLTISEYLRPRLFEPLGMDIKYWEKDKLGFDAGGWGLFFSVEDMAKLSVCMLQGGRWHGVQVIPEGWVEAMTTPYERNLYGLDAQNLGFGFNTWCGRYDGYYRLEGLYSQFSFVYPVEDACVAITCSDITHKVIFDLIDKYFPHAFKETTIKPSDDVLEDFNELLSSFSYDVLPVSPRNLATESGLSGKEYKLRTQKYFSMLPVSAYFTLAVKPGHMTNMSFDFNENYGEFSWDEDNSPRNTLCVNFDGKRRVSKVYLGEMTVHMLAFGAWKADNTLDVQVYTMEVPEVRSMNFRFDKKKLEIRNILSPNLYETLDNKYRFEGMKTNIILDTVAKLANVFGSIMFVPKKKKGKLIKKSSPL